MHPLTERRKKFVGGRFIIFAYPILNLGFFYGDFNNTLYAGESNGRRDSLRDMRDFQDFISNLDLLNLPLHGGRFISSNNRVSLVLARLDRFLVSPDFEKNSFPTAILLFQCLLRSMPHLAQSWFGVLPTPLPSDLKESWLSHDSFSGFIHNCWLSFSISGDVVSSYHELKLLVVEIFLHRQLDAPDWTCQGTQRQKKCLSGQERRCDVDRKPSSFRISILIERKVNRLLVCILFWW